MQEIVLPPELDWFDNKYEIVCLGECLVIEKLSSIYVVGIACNIYYYKKFDDTIFSSLLKNFSKSGLKNDHNLYLSREDLDLFIKNLNKFLKLKVFL